MAFSVNGHSHESISTRTDEDTGGDCFGGSVDNLSGRQLLAVAKATIMKQRGIKEVMNSYGSQRKFYPYDRIHMKFLRY